MLDLVNPLAGSDSDLTFSTGLTYPAVAFPWGMTFFSPRNGPGGAVFTRQRSRPMNRLAGFTATHAPSPWMGDYGSFTLMPLVGEVSDMAQQRERSYRLVDEQSRADAYRVRLAGCGTLCELTATCRCGVLRVTFSDAAACHLVLTLDSPEGSAEVHAGGRRVTGVARGHRGGVAGDFGCRFVLDVNAPITAARWIGDDGDRALVLSITPPPDRPITVRIGTSFISVEQAALNLDREVGGRDFDEVRAGTAELWTRELSRLTVAGGSEDQRRTFYTCLWRALLFPRTFHETDVDGRTVHYSPYTGRVEPGRLVTDNGFWDTSRTVYSLLSLAWPTRLGEILDGWLTAFRESGWMPQWASPGHRACMVGTHSAAVFADAITKGIGGFDYDLAYASMVRDASVPGDPKGKYGRQQLREYLDLGYCPELGGRDSVCRTLDYAYNDWCCAQVAEALGHRDEAQSFRARAANWRHLFDPQTCFFRPKLADGEWDGPLDELLWGGPYREGSAWQYRFAVPHDIPGLARAFGGADPLVAELERMLALPPHFRVGEYGGEIHEMAEMASASLGQYAHSNQPVHAFLWAAAQLGRPGFTDAAVRRVLTELYTPETFPGDEDNGEMGAWYVLAAIGLFPHCPGDPAYTATPPLFDAITLQADTGQRLHLPGDAASASATRRVTHAELFGGAHPAKSSAL